MNEVPATDNMNQATQAAKELSSTTPAGDTVSATETTAGGVPELRDKVLAALKTVYDPEIPVDVYELGLIYEINVYPVNNVYIQMTLTSPSCPSAEVIPGEVQQKIKAIEGVNDVKVDVTFDPPYSQDMMSEAAKLELGFM